MISLQAGVLPAVPCRSDAIGISRRRLRIDVRKCQKNVFVPWSFHSARHCLRRDADSEFVVFCFATPEDAEAFAAGFGGEQLPTNRAMKGPARTGPL